ncbi:MAG: phage BR0599 family protein [Wolbachia sp.]|nr:phage BR0599 family protein [Wolbachia sp.]MDD9335902.1 phage BR0599 family protein [Wolbachia sp.]
MGFTDYDEDLNIDKDKVVTLFTPPPYKISAGDQYSILACCDKTFLTCKNKIINNTVNFRGEPHIPGFISHK